MKKKIFIIAIIIIILILLFLIIYPNIEFRKDNKLYYFTYSDNSDEWDMNLCYDESYSYNEKRDISIKGWEYKEFLFFKLFVLEYKEGNVCATEYLLEPSYIEKVIKDAQITDNSHNIDLEKLIKDKKAIVGNTKYHSEDEKIEIYYTLDGKEEVMFIFYDDELLVIQVGLSDEGPKFIAYE